MLVTLVVRGGAALLGVVGLVVFVVALRRRGDDLTVPLVGLGCVLAALTALLVSST